MQTLSIAKMTEKTLVLTNGEQKRSYYIKTYGPLVKNIAQRSIKDGYMYNNYYERKRGYYVIKVYNVDFNRYYDVKIDLKFFEIARMYHIRVNVHHRTGEPIRVEFCKTNHSHDKKMPLADAIVDPNWMEYGKKTKTHSRPRTYSYANGDVLDLRSKNIIVCSQRDSFRDLLTHNGLYKDEQHFATYYRGILFDEVAQCLIGTVTLRGTTFRTRTFPIDFIEVEESVRMAVEFVAKGEKRYRERMGW